jgi:hypothetical protein
VGPGRRIPFPIICLGPAGAREKKSRGASVRPRRRVVGGCEPLESRRLLAVDVAVPIADQAFADAVAAPISLDLAEAFRDTAVTGTVVRFDLTTPLGDRSVFTEIFDAEGEDRARTTPKTAANFGGQPTGCCDTPAKPRSYDTSRIA